MRVRRMSDEPIGATTGQFDGPRIDPTEKDAGRIVGEGSRIEEGLQTIDGVRGGTNVQR